MDVPEFVVPQSVADARRMQDALRHRLQVANHFSVIDTIAGIDVGYDNQRGLAHASVVLVRRADLKMIAEARAFVPVDFPYIPGLLSFREIPAILAALRQLSPSPDLLMVDGQGIAHPRRLGIAAHLGIITDRPSIGVAKSRLTGRYAMPGPRKGDRTALMAGSERIGTVLRSKDAVKPLFISPGHRIDSDTALALTLADKLSKCKNEALLPGVDLR